MPIPFRDADDVEDLGTAGFLKIEPWQAVGYRGALFLVNARGEPAEFAYNRIATPHTFLWRQVDIRRNAERKLTASLFTVCHERPVILLCLADEVGSALFCQDIQLELPVCRIAPTLQATPHSSQETPEVTDAPEPIHLFWFPRAPEEESTARRLLRRLVSHGLLVEPFERAAIGLREVFPSDGTGVT